MRFGIDVGGTKTYGVAIDDTAAIHASVRRETGTGADQVVGSVVAVAQTLADRSGIKMADVVSIGVGIPGTVDRATGRVTHAVNLGVDELDLGRVMRDHLDVEVSIENDVNAAAMGAYHLNGDGVSSMAYLNLGTGLAAGLVLEGRLWRGADGIAGEIGHIPIDPSGDVCACGQRGCIETFASGTGLARRWPYGDRHHAASLFAAADRGDSAALAVRADFVVAVASAVRILVLTAGVDVVMVGGGISSLGEPLRADVAAILDDWAATSPFLASIGLSGRLRIVPDRSVTAAVGAALSAFA
jgi:glucokinase